MLFYSLRQSGAPLVQLAIEEGHDLSPWMSAIMAAAVRRSNSYRPISPLEKAFTLSQPQTLKSPYGYMKINIPSNDNEDGGSTYEVPMESFSEMFKITGYQSTPVHESEAYNPPLPPLPIDSDSSSETSSDYADGEDAVTSSKQLEQGLFDRKRQSLLDDGTDSPSDQSNHCLSFSESFVSDEAKCEKVVRKRSSKALSNASLDSGGSGSEITAKQQYTRKSSISNGPRTKRRRKQTSAESEAKFLQDPLAIHSGVLFQKRPLGVWSKRYCKLMHKQILCYRHADDIKPSLTIDLLDHDISLIDSKESKKAYGFKVSHPSLESYSFATDSRVAVERWIELLSLAATGRHDIIAPYPPYFKADSSDEQQLTKSHDSLNFDEDALESGDATDFTSHRSRIDDDTSCFAADELDEELSSDARDDSSHHKLTQRRVKSPPRRSTRHVKVGVRERALRRKDDKKTNETSSKDSSYVDQRILTSDSGGEGKLDNRV
ncbi:uncharacterized protein LOC110246067 [Exaiptasia diaphana]|uniref:PH domain-containing protein n=1 Tax=Exaiptasia diaphana TaxID=2652724 RepID=A0A913XQD9_EXADI|nr:uncharacterized protein LOC110246067 [Exaiptasia diaphana]